MVMALRRLVDSHGSQDAAAAALKVSPQFLCDVLAGRRGITSRLADAMGYQRVFCYVRKRTK